MYLLGESLVPHLALLPGQLLLGDLLLGGLVVADTRDHVLLLGEDDLPRRGEPSAIRSHRALQNGELFRIN